MRRDLVPYLLLSMGAERLREPLRPYLRIDPGIDYERTVPCLQPASNGQKIIRASDGDALGPRPPRDGGKVGLRESRHLYRPSHGAEVVDLRPVGRVVVDD